MKKRWLGILLTICMVLTLLPTAAWAEGEAGTVAEVGSAADLKAAIETGTASTVKLTANITINGDLNVDRSVMLDLNNCTLSATRIKIGHRASSDVVLPRRAARSMFRSTIQRQALSEAARSQVMYSQ